MTLSLVIIFVPDHAAKATIFAALILLILSVIMLLTLIFQ